MSYISDVFRKTYETAQKLQPRKEQSCSGSITKEWINLSFVHYTDYSTFIFKKYEIIIYV